MQEGSLVTVFEKVKILSAKPGDGDFKADAGRIGAPVKVRERLARVQLGYREVANRCYLWFEKGLALLKLQGGTESGTGRGVRDKRELCPICGCHVAAMEQESGQFRWISWIRIGQRRTD
jgi:hypothetical protein